MSTAIRPGEVWLVVTAVAAVSLAFRLSFFVLFSWMETVPARLEAALRYVGPSVIAALVLPAVLLSDDGVVTLFTPEVAAAAVATVVAWRTENIAATVGVGMVVLWTIEWMV